MAAVPLYAVIMAGGAGTRFWPASRLERPKQFLPIAGAGAMIAQTFGRLEGLVPTERVLVVTSERQVELVREALPELPAKNVLAEPEGRNTAPCIALATHEIAAREPSSVQVVLPADHVIEPAEAFRGSLAAAAAEAASGDLLVTFGIRPTHAATGYGYIERGEALAERDGHPVFLVQRFVEKPDRRTAEGFVASGRFFWNSGMFVWHTRAIQAALRRHLPELAEGFDRVRAGATLAAVYPQLPAVPIDVGVMERADNVRMLPIEYRWSDLGSWAALTDVLEPDGDGNWSVLGEEALLVAEDARGCVAYAQGDEVIALVGVRDLVVVRAGQATLICPRDRAQDVRLVVEHLRARGKRFL